MGDSTMDALRRYQDLGVDLDENFKQAPDHICPELEFMSLLVYMQLAGLRSGDPGQVQQMLSRQQSFLSNHLSRWIPQFTDQVMDYADTGFYRELARATRIFLDEDLCYLAAVTTPVAQSLETASS